MPAVGSSWFLTLPSSRARVFWHPLPPSAITEFLLQEPAKG